MTGDHGGALAVPGGASVAEPAAGVVDEPPLEGEIVDDPQPAPRVVVLRPVIQVFQAVTVAARHPRARHAARHAAYVPAGAVVLYRRRQHARTAAQRMAHQLSIQGDHDRALAMLQHAEHERHRRHERAQARLETALTLVKNSHWIAAAAAGGMLLLGMAIGDPAAPFRVAAGLVRAGWAAGEWGWRVGVFTVPAAVVVALHEVGRRAGDLAPAWARTAGDGDVDHEVTELLLTQALANMRIPQVRDYLKLGMPLQFVTSCRHEGRGTYAEIRLPGVPAEKVVRRRADFAAGVHRAAKEVWPSIGGEAALLRVWIADKGALEEGAGPYPLLGDGLTDVFKGVPFGRTLKGDPVKMPVIGRNSICGGAPEQGKSNSARVVACGYTLDVNAEMRIYVPDANFDFDWFAPRCSRYLVGAEDEVIEAMLEDQELLKEEIQHRGNLLRDYELQEVTREVARAGVGLHPVFILIEEAHVPITHKKHGKDFGQLLSENVRLCRKRGIHVMVSTQAPVRGSMPRDVTVNCTVGIAHALSDIYANDAILGPGAHSSGHRATELIPGADRGIALCKGFGSEARSEMVQVHRIQASKDAEQVTPLVNRALAAIAERGLAVPGTGRPLAITSRDLLADLAEVIGGSADRVRLADLPARLRKLAPSWGEYRGLTGVQLRERLKRHGVRVLTTGGILWLEPSDLRSAIEPREAE